MSTLDKVNAIILGILPEVLQGILLKDVLKMVSKDEFRQGLKMLFLESCGTLEDQESYLILYN